MKKLLTAALSILTVTFFLFTGCDTLNNSDSGTTNSSGSTTNSDSTNNSGSTDNSGTTGGGSSDEGSSGEEDNSGSEDDSGDENPDSSGDTSSNDTSVYKVYEAESATLSSSITTGTSGDVTYAYFAGSGSEITFTITAASETKAFLKIKSYGCGGAKVNYLSLNGTELGSFNSSDSTWDYSWNDYITLIEGENTISFIFTDGSWGYYWLDNIELVNPEDVVTPGFENFVTVPCNANADSAAKQLMADIGANYGKKIITGQMDLTWDDSTDMDARVYSDTGKHPKLMGYDFMNYLDYTSGSGLSQVEEAEAWWNKGGYVAFNWHWRVTGPNGNNSFNVYSSSTTDGTDFVIPYSDGEWDTTSEYYTQLVDDMKVIATKLQVLRDAGVPVLWRPLHEGAGAYASTSPSAWFWWGNSGADAYIALWKLMYKIFTEDYNLTNLLWVWNGQSADYYPGDDYVDFIGLDIYETAKDYSSKYSRFVQAVKYCDNYSTAPKMVALTENGTIPSPSECEEDGAMWAWFMTWNDGSAGEGVDDSDNFWTGEYYNEDSHKKEVYDSNLVITR